MTPKQIEIHQKLGKMTVLKIIENSNVDVDFNENNLKIQKNIYSNGAYSEG